MQLLAEVLGLPTVIIIAVFTFVVGTVFGSFINCVAWRICAGESFLSGRSHCTSCGHELGVLELIPVLSWVISGGKCKHCGAHVSVRYLLTEVLMGVVFVVLVMVYGLSIEALAYFGFACCLLGLSLVDLDTMTIPNGFLLAAIVIWLLYLGLRALGLNFMDSVTQLVVLSTPVTNTASIFTGIVGSGVLAQALDGLLAGVVFVVAILLISLVMDMILGRASLGGGDIKLLGVAGLYLGLACSVLNIFIACVLGIIFSVAWGMRPKLEAQDGEEGGGAKPFPFGPAISVATLLTLLVGPLAVNAYLGLFMF